jgi:hypothetical protein
MNVSGKVLKANVVRGRDAYELELRIELKDGKADVYAPTSSYVGNLAMVALNPVPIGHWPEVAPVDMPQPAPADFAPTPLPTPTDAKPPKEEKAPGPPPELEPPVWELEPLLASAAVDESPPFAVEKHAKRSHHKKKED